MSTHKIHCIIIEKQKMKNLKKISGLLFLFSCLAITFTSCDNDDDNNTPQPQVKVEDVIGNYSGKLLTTQGKTSNEASVTFAATKDIITFTELPVKQIVTSVVKDATKAEAALKALGKVKYELNYTAALTSAKTAVELTFTPKALEIQLPVDGAKKKVIVTFTAKQKGLYTIIGKDKTLKLELIAEKISVDATDLTPLDAIKYEVPLSKKQ